MESTSTPQHEVPAAIIDDIDRCCVEDHYWVYRDAKMLNDKGVMTRMLTVEWRFLTESLHIVPIVHDLFTCHQLEWKVRSVGPYSEDMVRELYASYVVTLRGPLDWRANPAMQAPITDIRVRGCRVDISSPTIRRFLYGKDTDDKRIPLI